MERLCTLNTATLSTWRRGRIWRQSQHKTHWITFRGHSRSRILGSLKSRRGPAYYCIIMWP